MDTAEFTNFGANFFFITSPSGPSYSRGLYITTNDAPQSVGLLWTRDQFVTETSTWQHTALTTVRHPWPRRVSNPQSQQTSGLTTTP